MATVIIIEPNISQEENEENLQKIIDVLKEIAYESQELKEV